MAAGTDGRVKVVLGEHTYTPSPQRAGYIEHVLWPGVQAVFEAEDGTDGEVSVESEEGSALSLARERAYDLLALFLPADPRDPAKGTVLMPKHEFMGFGTQAAYEAGEYEMESDKSPTIPEIADAITLCITVNGGKVSDYLKALVSPEKLTQLFSPQVLQGMGDLLVATLAEQNSKN